MELTILYNTKHVYSNFWLDCRKWYNSKRTSSFRGVAVSTYWSTSFEKKICEIELTD